MGRLSWGGARGGGKGGASGGKIGAKSWIFQTELGLGPIGPTIYPLQDVSNAFSLFFHQV